MRNNFKKIIAFTVALLVLGASSNVYAITGEMVTDTLALNETGQQGIVVYSATIEEEQQGEEFTLQVANFTQGMSNVNVAIFVDNTVVTYRIGLIEYEYISFILPNGNDFSIVASTNSPMQGSFALTISSTSEEAEEEAVNDEDINNNEELSNDEEMGNGEELPNDEDINNDEELSNDEETDNDEELSNDEETDNE